MNYSKYQKSRDLSWEVLIKNNISELPVKVSGICSHMDIKVISYSAGKSLIDRLNMQRLIKSSDGFTYGGAIFYNDGCSVARQRFTVAHELGHILLHGGHGVYNREPCENDNPIEQEANVFASRLLAPACVLWGLGIANAQQISDFCNISRQSAEFRMKRMQELYNRESGFLKKYKKSCFLTSPLERAVYSQFFDYISSHKL